MVGLTNQLVEGKGIAIINSATTSMRISWIASVQSTSYMPPRTVSLQIMATIKNAAPRRRETRGLLQAGGGRLWRCRSYGKGIANTMTTAERVRIGLDSRLW
ncbi:MAG: hypothetical protein M2R45_03255 [Verrucomicrobia subdivision 3 bacterium]|nr:hypothetical protein [Limisphaerales bacterium]MCS1416116.1 hypothetical protein [Limisphaerales bacterium]